MIIDKELINSAKIKYGEDAAYKIAEDLNIENFNEKDLKGCCPFHGERTPSFVWNEEEKYYHCFGCGKNYGIIDHYMQYDGMTFVRAIQKLFEQTETQYRFGEHEVQKDKNYVYPHYENGDRAKAEKYLTLRKISINTMDYCNIQADKHGNIAYHYVDENDVLMLVKYRKPYKLSKTDIKSWSQEGKSTAPVLFNMNRIDVTQPLIITEGEIDCLSVIEAGSTNCVSIPFGAQSEKWIEHNWEWLDQFSKIIIWSDNDSAGINMRKTVCARLGSWRTYYVDVPNIVDGKRIKDANEVLYYLGKEGVKKYIDTATLPPIEHVIDMYDVNDYDIENAEGLHLGIEKLDKYLYKVIFGTVTVWTGVNSSGKSVLVNQLGICESINQGYDVFVFSGELPKPMLKNWIERTMAGTGNIQMENDHIRHIDQNKVRDMREWYKNRLWIYDNDQDYSADTLLDKMEEMARRHGVKVFVIDNLMMVDLGGSEANKYEKQTQFMKKLVNFANKYNVIVHLIAHPKKIEQGRRVNKMDVSGTGDITNLAQYVIAIHRYTDKEREKLIDETNGNIYDCVLSLFKNRVTGTQDKDIQVWFDRPSYRFYTSDKELYKKYEWDKSSDVAQKNNDRDTHTLPF